MRHAGVSFVVPVHRGEPWLADTLASIAAQADGRPMEIILVDDHHHADSPESLPALAARFGCRVVRGPVRGAPAAVNAGIRAARMPLICQVDQDVVLEPGWLAELTAAFDDPTVGAAQGYYATDPRSSLLSRVMGLDLEWRYSAIDGTMDHVCTGNSVYRADALAAVGLLDEALGYGYDNDLSYRLDAAGYGLAFRPAARSRHRWREGWRGYAGQQYGFGYGRVDLVAKHPQRCTGDAVSPVSMMAHPLVMTLACAMAALAAAVREFGGPAVPLLTIAAALVAGLAAERAVAGVRAWRRFGDPAALAFPVVHTVRDLAWVGAILTWCARRVLGRPALPAHSMRPRTLSQ